ncbi:MAG TPA: protein kinase, partial [Aggregatilineales bacterium]|nr:protein kinase [Aggregatilineales bacterium]
MQTIDSASQIIGGRYRLLNQLGSGGMGSVFRAVDRLSGQTVALKRVTQAEVGIQDGDSFGLRLALAREFHTLASLRHPHIISVLDYGFDEQGQPYLTMELLESAQDVLEAGKGLSLSAQLRLLVQLLQALLYLHRSGVIHRDLKPANVLVADAQVKVLDFGLAATRGETDVNSDHVSGTLAYMAPELLSGATANEASDLYAVGIIAYQLLAGHHPFDRANMAVLLQQIVEAQPNVEQLGVDSRLAGVIERLLAKSPDKRYSEAALVVAALGQATDQELSLETAITRESFLQASRFVGRDAELKQLVATLTPAIAGQGSAWLVGGESGVGKSRLLDEVRTQALVRGVLVLRGQVISEGSSPYQLWRDILRRLILTIDLSDFEAGVLMSLVPDISALLERPIPEVPDVEGQAVQERLLSTIEAIFRRQQQPILLLIEDLHWATESLDVLQRLTRIAHDLPLVIIGSYRSDERPDLPEVLQNMRLLGLNRFAGNHLAELSESMLGAAGRRPEIINLLQKETEGNVFFLVEVVRSLAEEAGELDKIGTMELPEKVVAGGVESILQRRLKRVPQSAYKLLELAAVSGRLLDLKILGSLDPTTNLDQWLSSCASVPVLDVQDGRWRFSHDKLRETMLATLPDERRPTLHEQVAKVIEQNYPDAPDRYAELAYHWKAAGVTVKAADYLGKAGEQALRVYANQDAASFFSEAIALL